MNIKFNDGREVLPEHGEDVWYIQFRYGFGECYSFVQARAEYIWDADGYSICFNPKDPFPPEPDIDAETGEEILYKLTLLLGRDSFSYDGMGTFGPLLWTSCSDLEKELKKFLA